MRLGQQIGTYGPSAHGNHWDTTLAAALACEEAGLGIEGEGLLRVTPQV